MLLVASILTSVCGYLPPHAPLQTLPATQRVGPVAAVATSPVLQQPDLRQSLAAARIGTSALRDSLGASLVNSLGLSNVSIKKRKPASARQYGMRGSNKKLERQRERLAPQQKDMLDLWMSQYARTRELTTRDAYVGVGRVVPRGMA